MGEEESPVVMRPRVRCRIRGNGTVHAEEVEACSTLSDAQRSRVLLVGLDAARGHASRHRGKLWINCQVTKKGDISVCGVSTVRP